MTPGLDWQAKNRLPLRHRNGISSAPFPPAAPSATIRSLDRPQRSPTLPASSLVSGTLRAPIAPGERSIIFDTETTGLDPLNGDRVIEIACIELERDLPTGRTFYTLLDPERDVPPEASRIHGYTRADLVGAPRFADIAAELLDFFGPDRLIAHNAVFDFGFIDMELGRAKHPALGNARMVDTLAMAKARFPGLPNSLDALCRRFAIDLSERTSHSALLDCRLLADVYVELTGGRQRGLELAGAGQDARAAIAYASAGPRRIHLFAPTPEQLARHAAFLTRIPNAVWLAE